MEGVALLAVEDLLWSLRYMDTSRSVERLMCEAPGPGARAAHLGASAIGAGRALSIARATMEPRAWSLSPTLRPTGWLAACVFVRGGSSC